MKASLFAAAVLIVASFSVFGQQLSAADQEMMKIRQTLSDEYSAAAAKKDLADMVDHYTADVIIATICPESTPIVGREAYTRRSETLLKAGFRDYVGKVTQAHVLSSDEAWSTDTSSFTVTDKEGKPQQIRGTWIDMLRREGKVWRVRFQAFATTC